MAFEARPLTLIALDLTESEIAYLINYVGPFWYHMVTSDEVEALLESQRHFNDSDRLWSETVFAEETADEFVVPLRIDPVEKAIKKQPAGAQ